MSSAMISRNSLKNGANIFKWVRLLVPLVFYSIHTYKKGGLFVFHYTWETQNIWVSLHMRNSKHFGFITYEKLKTFGLNYIWETKIIRFLYIWETQNIRFHYIYETQNIRFHYILETLNTLFFSRTLQFKQVMNENISDFNYTFRAGEGAPRSPHILDKNSW